MRQLILVAVALMLTGATCDAESLYEEVYDEGYYDGMKDGREEICSEIWDINLEVANQVC